VTQILPRQGEGDHAQHDGGVARSAGYTPSPPPPPYGWSPFPSRARGGFACYSFRASSISMIGTPSRTG
jgi:hypothetical protein